MQRIVRLGCNILGVYSPDDYIVLDLVLNSMWANDQLNWPCCTHTLVAASFVVFAFVYLVPAFQSLLHTSNMLLCSCFSFLVEASGVL